MEILRGPRWKFGGLAQVLTPDSSQSIGMATLFPLYAWLVKLASVCTLGASADVAGMLVSNLSLGIAGILLFRLVKVEGLNERTAEIAVALLMFAPGSYFFSTATPDALNLALALATLYLARQRRGYAATTVALLLCGSTPLGFWIAVPLAADVYFKRQAGLTPKLHDLLPIAAILLQFVTIGALGAIWFGDWSIGFHLSHSWNEQYRQLVELSRSFRPYRAFYQGVFWGSIGCATGLLAAGWIFRMTNSWLAYSAAFVFVLLWTFDFQAIRTLLQAFPLPIAAAMLSDRVEGCWEVFLASSITGLALCTIVSANGFWLS
jgi:hypothetical protein